MTRRWLLLTAAAICVVAGLASGTAYAYFTSSGTGTGTGSGSVGIMQTVTISSATVSPGTPLLPGGSGDVTLQVTNPNGFAVTVVSVAATGGAITADSGHPGCTTPGVTFTSQTGLSTVIQPDSTAPIDLPGAASLSTASSPGCQGATFPSR